MNSKKVLKLIKDFHQQLLGKKEGRLSFYYTYHSLQYESFSQGGKSFEEVLSTLFSPIKIPKERIDGRFGSFYVDRFGNRLVYVYRDLVIEDKLSDPSILNEIKADQDGYQEWLIISKIFTYPPSNVKIFLKKSKVDLVLEKVKDYFIKMHGNDGERLYNAIYHYAEAEAFKERGKGLKKLLKNYIVEYVQLKGTEIPGKLGKFYIFDDEKEIGYEYDNLKLIVKYEINDEDFKTMRKYVERYRELIPNAKGDPEDWIINVFKAPFVNNAKIYVSIEEE